MNIKYLGFGLILFLAGFWFFQSKYRRMASVYVTPQWFASAKIKKTLPTTKPLKNLLDSAKKAHQKPLPVSLLVEKSALTLSVKYGTHVLKSYPVVLGFKKEGDKMQEGDGATPEGIFKIRDKYPHASWTYFMWIDYPNESSWKKFNQRKKDGNLAKEAKIGGAIGIHGTPDGKDYLIDKQIHWTLGCVSLKNKHIKELFPCVPVGAKVQVLP